MQLNTGLLFFPAPTVRTLLFALALAGLLPSPLAAHELRPSLILEDVDVIGRGDDLQGVAVNATEGYTGQNQLSARPLLRTGEVLETIPGLIATQHSGTGKGNQMFLRGFNLDHGTDFATWVAGMPVNLPTHAHGQGYTDLNFIIPELIAHIRFRKGPYYADEGDFSAAGSAHISYFDALPDNLAVATTGSDDYYRGLLAGSTHFAGGHLLGAFEAMHDDGPWENPQSLGKLNGVLRYSGGSHESGFSFTGMAYAADWNATDQIPLRAARSGQLSRLGTIDPSDGGETHRVSLSADWFRRDAGSSTEIDAYAIDYRLRLFSNFTFFLSDPVNGDQFEQFDERQIYGGQLRHTLFDEFFGRRSETTFGLQGRFDDIGTAALFNTNQRRRLSVVSNNTVDQLSVSPYIENETQWLPKLRTRAGVRADFYHFDVESNIPVNSSSRSDAIVSPKLNVILGPWYDTEFYFSAGRGFHSNDARGTTRTVDPRSGARVERVDPLVSSEGVELGVRSNYFPDLRTSLSLFMLQLDSELVFVGDEGTTEANPATRRLGLEWSNFWTPLPWLSVDADLALTRSRFRDDASTGARIPNALEKVITAGVTVDNLPGRWRPWSSSLRLRHFGSYPLVEDNSVRAGSTTLVNLSTSYAISDTFKISAGVFNLFDSDDSDIEYFYASRMPGETAGGIEDIHFHPVLPRQFRISLSWRF